MATSIRTLRDALTQQKPTINCATNNKNTHKNDETWPNMKKNMKLWAGFNIKTLNKQYGGVLDMELPEGVPVPQASGQLENLVIHEVKDIKKIVAWNVSILGPALDFGRSMLQHQGPRLVHEHGHPLIPGAKSQTRVDHLIKVVDAPSRVLVVGLGTTSAKFEGDALRSVINQNKASRHENSMRQLAHACNLANARYGYLQTDRELVACRFSNTDDVWEAEFMPIPMELFGGNGLTAELAIWWMAMLAMPRSEDSVIYERAQQDGAVATAGRAANNDHQADVTHPDINAGVPSAPDMGFQDINAGVPSAPDMGFQDINAGVPNAPDMGFQDINAGVPNAPDMGFQDNNAGLSGALNADVRFDPGMNMSEAEFAAFLDPTLYQS